MFMSSSSSSYQIPTPKPLANAPSTSSSVAIPSSPSQVHILLLHRLVSLITRCWNWGWSSRRWLSCWWCIVFLMNIDSIGSSGLGVAASCTNDHSESPLQLLGDFLMGLVSRQWVAVNWWWWHPWLAGYHSLSSSPRSSRILLSPKWHCSKLGLPSPFASSCLSFSASQKGSRLRASTCSTLVASPSGYWQGASQGSNCLAMRSHPSHFVIKKGNLLVSMEQKL